MAQQGKAGEEEKVFNVVDISGLTAEEILTGPVHMETFAQILERIDKGSLAAISGYNPNFNDQYEISPPQKDKTTTATTPAARPTENTPHL